MRGEQEPLHTGAAALLRASLRAAPPEDLEQRVLARLRTAEAGARPQAWWFPLRRTAFATASALLVLTAARHLPHARPTTPALAKRCTAAVGALEQPPADPLLYPGRPQIAAGPARRSGLVHVRVDGEMRMRPPAARGTKLEPAVSDTMDAAEGNTPVLLAQAAPGHALPVLQDALVPGEAPPAFPGSETPGQRLPQFTMAGVPGYALPAFPSALENGDRP